MKDKEANEYMLHVQESLSISNHYSSSSYSSRELHDVFMSLPCFPGYATGLDIVTKRFVVECWITEMLKGAHLLVFATVHIRLSSQRTRKVTSSSDTHFNLT